MVTFAGLSRAGFIFADILSFLADLRAFRLPDLIIGAESVPYRPELDRAYGADEIVDFHESGYRRPGRRYDAGNRVDTAIGAFWRGCEITGRNQDSETVRHGM